MRRILLIVCSVLCLGCSRLRTEYGLSYDVEGHQSIAGFGVLRDFYRRQGWSDRTVSRLSERLNNVDAIVWTPTVETPPTLEVTEWFEQWLSRGDKTLVYVLRDHETADAYWRIAAPLADPDQRLEYRRRQARARMEKLQALLARPTQISNGWFTAVPLAPPAVIGETQGPWSDEVYGFSPAKRIEYKIRPYDPQNDPKTPTVGGVLSPFTIQTYAPTDTPVDLTVPLATREDIPLVARVTSDQWGGSQVIVVAGGSLLTNFGLVDAGSRRLAARLVEASVPSTGTPGKVGFLYSDEQGVSISTLDPEKMGPSGMELLTAWPINLITIHGTVLAFVACLMLFPIFGRPRRLRPRSNTDFADHVKAVAALMARTQGIQYARVRISEYMVRVRGESEGPWIIPPPPIPPEPPDPPTTPVISTDPAHGELADAPPASETR